MTLTLDLPPKLVDELAAEAARLGLSVSEYAVRVLSQSRSLRAAPRTGADLVTLCTFNSKHYRAVPGLSILEPYVKP